MAGEQQAKWQLEKVSLSTQLKQLQSSNANLLSELEASNALSSELARAQSRLRLIEVQNDNLQQENNALQAALSELRTSSTARAESLESSLQAYQDLRAQILEADSLAKELAHQNSLLQARVDISESQALQLVEKVTSLSTAKQSLELKVNEQAASIQLLLQTNANLLEQSNATQLASTADHYSSKSQLEALVSNLQAECASQKAANASLQQENANLQQANANLQQANANLQQKQLGWQLYSFFLLLWEHVFVLHSI